MLLYWQFQLAFAKPYGQGLLHQWSGHSPNLNLIENWWRPTPNLILFHSYFNASHSIPFHSIPISRSHSNLTLLFCSVIALKRIDRFWCAWCQSLAFFKLYMIHVKKSKIDQEKAELWVLGVSRLQMPDFPTPILATCLILTSYIRSVIAPKRIDRFWCVWCQSLAFSKLYMMHIKTSKIE